jgi:quercetin dioxygenase-like cupin family protein
MTHALPRELPRRIYHPVQRDYATFVETAAESGGARTVVEVELAPGGGTPPHYHGACDETFEAVEGVVSIQLGDVVHRLAPGERATAERGVLHRFFNETDAPVRFRVVIAPGSIRFERCLRIAYGLAGDDLVRPRGALTRLAHGAVVFELSESHVAGASALLLGALRVIARIARTCGVERALVARYCT